MAVRKIREAEQYFVCEGFLHLYFSPNFLNRSVMDLKIELPQDDAGRRVKQLLQLS